MKKITYLNILSSLSSISIIHRPGHINSTLNNQSAVHCFIAVVNDLEIICVYPYFFFTAPQLALPNVLLSNTFYSICTEVSFFCFLYIHPIEVHMHTCISTIFIQNLSHSHKGFVRFSLFGFFPLNSTDALGDCYLSSPPPTQRRKKIGVFWRTHA